MTRDDVEILESEPFWQGFSGWAGCDVNGRPGMLDSRVAQR